MKDLVENKDYELIPNDDDGWDIRIIDGEFSEVVFGDLCLKIDEESDSLNFSFKIIYSPVDYIDEDNVDLQEFVRHTIISLSESEKLGASPGV